MNNNSRKGEGEVGVIAFISFVALVLLIGGCWAKPNYDVWQQEKEGQAAYAKAESTRKITVLEAQAKKDSAQLLAEAEVARAHGVAQANQIIGDSLKGNELYLHYLWINGLQEGRNDIIYVPTEAGIPIMEAGRSLTIPHEKKQ